MATKSIISSSNYGSINILYKSSYKLSLSLEKIKFIWALTFSGRTSLLYSLGAYEAPVLIPGDEPIPPKLLTYLRSAAAPMTLQGTKCKVMHKIFLIQPNDKTYKEKTLGLLIKDRIQVRKIKGVLYAA
jgi:hypothetical protein